MFRTCCVRSVTRGDPLRGHRRRRRRTVAERSATELLTQIRQAVDEYQQSVVMVTHDPRAAAYADRVLFLADGRLVRELPGPTVDLVLDAIRELGGEGGAGR